MKIKENVDLKELEKFGFYNSKDRPKVYERLIKVIKGNDYCIKVRADRSVVLRHYSSECKKLNEMSYFIQPLFELIQAGLIEE